MILEENIQCEWHGARLLGAGFWLKSWQLNMHGACKRSASLCAELEVHSLRWARAAQHPLLLSDEFIIFCHQGPCAHWRALSCARDFESHVHAQVCACLIFFSIPETYWASLQAVGRREFMKKVAQSSSHLYYSCSAELCRTLWSGLCGPL